MFRKQQNVCNWPKKRTMSVSAVLSLLAHLALNSLLLLQSRENIVESNCCTVELSSTQFWELKSTESVSFDTETVSIHKGSICISLSKVYSLDCTTFQTACDLCTESLSFMDTRRFHFLLFPWLCSRLSV